MFGLLLIRLPRSLIAWNRKGWKTKNKTKFKKRRNRKMRSALTKRMNALKIVMKFALINHRKSRSFRKNTTSI